MATIEPITDFTANYLTEHPHATMLEAAEAERAALESDSSWTLGCSLNGQFTAKRKIEELEHISEGTMTDASPPSSLGRPPRTRPRTLVTVKGAPSTAYTFRSPILRLPAHIPPFLPPPLAEDQVPEMETGHSTPPAIHDPETPKSEFADDEMTVQIMSDEEGDYISHPSRTPTQPRSIDRDVEGRSTRCESAMSVDTIDYEGKDVQSLRTLLHRVQFSGNDGAEKAGSRRDPNSSVSMEEVQSSVITAQ